jgi:hypothetical protein
VASIEALRQAIRERTKTEKVLSKTAIVRQLLPEVEAARQKGFTFAQLAEWLREAQGLDLSGRRLAVMVAQIRARKKPQKKKQLSIFDQLSADEKAEKGKTFRHDPLGKGDGLI